MIIFKKDEHKYTYKGNILTSGTTFIKQFKKDFDKDFISTHTAAKKILGEIKYRKIAKSIYGKSWPLPKDWENVVKNLVDSKELEKEIKNCLKSWEDSSIDGTAFHDEREEEAYEAGKVINPFTEKEVEVQYFDKEHDNQSLMTDLYHLPDGYYPELLVWDNTFAKDFVKNNKVVDQKNYDKFMSNTIAGQADCVYIETIDGVRYFDIDDYKTSKDKNKISEYKSSRYFPPFSHLWDNKMTDYSLQSNLYQYFLKSFGFKKRYSSFTFYVNYDPSNYIRYGVKDYQKEIEQMLEIHYKNVLPVKK